MRDRLPGVIIEVRMDSAFFSDEIVTALIEQNGEFTIRVPFERFVELKQLIERRQRWFAIDDELSYFETEWKPKSWPRRCRFLMIRTLTKVQQKGPVQLDLFKPYESGYEFKVIVTNKELGANAVVDYHSGRGSQEGVFAELKTQCQMDYVPVKKRLGNETYLLTRERVCTSSHPRIADATGPPPRANDDSQMGDTLGVRASGNIPEDDTSTRPAFVQSFRPTGTHILRQQEPKAARVANLPRPNSVIFFATLGTIQARSPEGHDSANTSLVRLKERVQQGGHDVPEEDIRRQFLRCLKNLWELYRPLADHWTLLYNLSEGPSIVAIGTPTTISIENSEVFQQIQLDLGNR